MSDKKTSFPRRALLVRANYDKANSYSDSFVVRAVEVLSVIDGQAACRMREGGSLRVETHPVTMLASTPDKAAALCASHFAALLSRALLQPVAVKTESTAAEPSAVNVQDAPAPVESQPEPLAGPRIRPRFSYANT
jgi:hypothetical protein